MTIRERHWVDAVPDPLHPRQRQRTIGNWLSYRTPAGVFAPVDVRVRPSTGTPPNWGSGRYDFGDESTEAPLHFFSRDTTDPDNRAMVGFRPDDAPHCWLNIKARNVTPGVPTTGDAQRAEWVGLWTNSTLRWTHAVHYAKEEIFLSAPGHPAYFESTVRVADGCTFAVADNVYTLRDPQGDVRLKSRAPFGRDANGAYIRATLTYHGTLGPPEQRLHVIRLTPDANDLAGATYPVVLDPTTDVTGASAYFENSLRYQGVAGRLDWNHGARTSFLMADVYDSSGAGGGGWDWRPIQRIDGTVIPAGTITAADWKITASANATVTGGFYACRILSGNAGWLQGGADGAAETGSSCGNYKAYDATTPTSWAGSVGIWSDGVDYTLDRSSWPGPVTVVSTTQYTWPIAPAWMTSARDDSGNEAGWTVVNGSSGVTTTHQYHSTESATSGYRPVVTITYNVPPKGAFFFAPARMI